MEAKTSYSSMAAKPPPKANDAPPTKATKPKNPTSTKCSPDRFVGHNQTDLKGILIPEDATAKHYNELKDRLETLGGSKYIPQVGSSIKHLVQFKRKDFAPTKPTAAEYSMPVPGLKEILMDTYKEELKKKANEWIQYQRDMEKLYRLALSQIDDGMKAKLKALNSWKAIDNSKCIVALLKAVQDLCFQSSQTKLLCTQQRSLDAASYVKMVKENLDVVKSLGGTLVCKATVSYELERNPAYSAYDYFTYRTLTGPTKVAIDHAAEQSALAALIIEGSDTSSSNLQQVLADNYALQQNNYPTTSVEALDMVVAFKDLKKPRSRTNNRGPATTSQNDRQRDRKKDESPNQGSSLFAQQGNGTGGTTNNLSTDQHSRQLLMTAVESGEVFTSSEQTTYMFLNIGMLSQAGAEDYESTTSSSTSSTSTHYDSDDEDVPNLVPRTNRYPNNDEEDSPLDYHFSNDVEYLFTQLKSEGGVNPYWILLDSESSLNLIVNPELVDNICQSPNNGFMNIHCNSGVSRTNMIADLLGFGTVWFYEDGLANVLSLALVSDQYRVTMDTTINNAIYVHKDSGTRRFERSACNLYYCNMWEHNGTVLALDTVESKAHSYSALNYSGAKKARDLQEVLGFPTTQELIKMINNK
eukprot:jgi/Psemu1/56796/gm1.56796_g